MAVKVSRRVVLGRVVGAHGVRGWVKVYSHTDPRENILDYSPWYLDTGDEWRAARLLNGRRRGKGLVARLDGCDDRETARQLLDAVIAVDRSQLPALESGEYYWTDLIGLRVVNQAGVDLGSVEHLMETGSNDVLVVVGESERLVPYLPGDVVLEVDLSMGVLRVDWDADL